jgi:hypothetical protein
MSKPTEETAMYQQEREREQQQTQKKNPITEALHGIQKQAMSAMSSLTGASSNENAWIQPFSDAKGAVVGKSKFDREDAKSDALRLRQAMKGIGTDKDVIVDITGNRTFEQRRMIAKEYCNLDEHEKRCLITDFKNDLSGDLQNLVVPLYMWRGEFDAHLMEQAMRGIGTDTDLLNEILCTRTNDEIYDMKIAWREYIDSKQRIEDRVSDETKKFFGVSHYHNLCLKLLEGKRALSQLADDKSVHADAEELNRLLIERSDANVAERKFLEIFTERSWPHIRSLQNEFQNISKKWTLEGAVDQQFGQTSNIAQALRFIIEFSIQPYDFWAKRLRDAMKGITTNDSKVIRIVVSRCEIDMANIVQVFGQRYGEGKTLKNWIEQETSGPYSKLLLNLCGFY